MTNLDSLGHQYVTQFRYHDGYYDPVEKQFRGFGRVEQIDVGDPTAPSLITRSHFDTGRIHESMKGKLRVLSVEQEEGIVFSTTTTFGLCHPSPSTPARTAQPSRMHIPPAPYKSSPNLA